MLKPIKAILQVFTGVLVIFGITHAQTQPLAPTGSTSAAPAPAYSVEFSSAASSNVAGKTITIKAGAGKLIQTQGCGAVSELTLTHKASEPAMVGQVLQAMNAGKVLVLIDGQCVGGKAIATSASPVISAAQAAPVMSQADRCKLPLAKERMAGC